MKKTPIISSLFSKKTLRKFFLTLGIFFFFTTTAGAVTTSNSPTSGYPGSSFTVSWSSAATNCWLHIYYRPNSTTAWTDTGAYLMAGSGSQPTSQSTVGSYGYYFGACDDGSPDAVSYHDVIPPPAPTVTLSAFSPSSILVGQSSSISFSSTNATSCSGTGVFQGNLGGTSNPGASTGAMNTPGTYTQSVTCSGAGGSGTSVTRSLVVSAPAVTATLTQSSASTVSGGSYTLTWGSTNATSCSISYTGPDGGGSIPTGGAPSGSFNLATTIAGTYVATNTCTGAGGSNSASVTHTVTAPSLPDLTAGNLSPTNATVGTPVTISSTITNNGTAPTGSSFSSFIQFIDGNNVTTDIPPSTIPALAANGGSGTLSFNANPGAPGTFQIRACADKSDRNSAGTINESNEANNCSGWVTLTYSCANGTTWNGTSCAAPVIADSGTKIITRGDAASMGVNMGGTVTSCSPSTTYPSTAGDSVYSTWTTGSKTNGQTISYAKVLGNSSASFPQTYNFTCTAPGYTANTHLQIKDCVSPAVWNGTTCATPTPTCANGANDPPTCSVYTITASTGANGTVTPAGASTVARGGSKAYTITPNAGYVVATIVRDGATFAPASSYTFTNVTANHTISATFTRAPATGTLTMPTTCVISVNASSCSISISWTTQNATNTVTVERGYSPFGAISGGTGTSGTTAASYSPPGSYRMDLMHDGRVLDSKVLVVSCATNTRWNGTKCETAATGTLTMPTTCTIPTNNASCPISISWTTQNATSTVTVERGYDPFGVINGGTGTNGTTTSNYSPPGSYRMNLMHDGRVLDYKVLVVSCASNSSWNGNVCEIPPPAVTNLVLSGNNTTSGSISFSCTNSSQYSIVRSEGATGIFPQTNKTYTGPVTVSVSVAGNYQVICSNGTQTASQTVTYDPNPASSSNLSLTATPRSIEKNAKVTLNWSIVNPSASCRIVVTPVCTATCDSARTTEASALQSTLDTGSTDSNDIYGASRTMTSALQTPYVAGGTVAKGKKTIQVNYTTDFKLQCGTNAASTTIRVLVTKANEG